MILRKPQAEIPQPQQGYQQYVLPDTSQGVPQVDFGSLPSMGQGSGEAFMIDPVTGGPQITPTTIAAGYGRKTPGLRRPNPYQYSLLNGGQ